MDLAGNGPSLGGPAPWGGGAGWGGHEALRVPFLWGTARRTGACTFAKGREAPGCSARGSPCRARPTCREVPLAAFLGALFRPWPLAQVGSGRALPAELPGATLGVGGFPLWNPRAGRHVDAPRAGPLSAADPLSGSFQAFKLKDCTDTSNSTVQFLRKTVSRRMPDRLYATPPPAFQGHPAAPLSSLPR